MPAHVDVEELHYTSNFCGGNARVWNNTNDYIIWAKSLNT